MDGKYSAPEPRAGLRRGPRLARSAIAAALAAALAASVPLLSCSRRAEEGTGRSEPGATARPQAKKEGAASSIGPLPSTPDSAAAKVRAAVPVMAASIRAFGLGSPTTVRMPEDYSLGPLQDYRVAGEDAIGALATARRFMEGMASGKLDPALLAPISREALALLLAPAPSGGGGARSAAQVYRLGALSFGGGGDSAYLRVRLPGATGEERLEGSLALGKVEGAWYVEALSLDPGAAGPLRFDPARSE